MYYYLTIPADGFKSAHFNVLRSCVQCAQGMHCYSDKPVFIWRCDSSNGRSVLVDEIN